jgi:hypothetical protein
MRTRLIYLFFLLFWTKLNLISQNIGPFQSAIIIAKVHGNDTVDNIFDDLSYTDEEIIDSRVKWLLFFDPTLRDTLKKNTNIEINDTLISKIAKQYIGNPFICDSCVVRFGNSQNAIDNSTGTVVASVASKGISLTNLADGTAQFITKRVKEELSINFFEKLKEQINTSEELGAFFPETKEHLQLIDKEIYRFNNYIKAFETTIVSDLKTLPGNLSKYFITNEDLKGKKESVYAADWFTVTQMMLDEKSPAEVFDFLANKGQIQGQTEDDFKNLKASLQTINLLSKAFMTTDSTWATPTDIQEAFESKAAQKFILGLLYQASSEISFNSDSTLQEIINKREGKIFDMQRFYAEVNQLGKNIAQIKVKKKKKEDLIYSDYYLVIDGLINTSRAGKAVLENLIKLKNDKTFDEVNTMIQGLDFVNKITLDVYQNEYSSAVFRLTNLLKLVLKDEFEGKLPRKFLEYATFLASLAESDTPGEVAQVIESFALPAGSASIKKQSGFDMAFGAYLGPTAGYENLYGVDEPEKLNFLGLTTPLGLTISTRIKKGSLTLFGSLFDIGAITAYRFVDDETENLPEIKLENILAPGLHLMYGTPKLPVAIGIGVQHGPNLRSVDPLGYGIEEANGVRFGFTLALDLPMVTLFNIR